MNPNDRRNPHSIRLIQWPGQLWRFLVAAVGAVLYMIWCFLVLLGFVAQALIDKRKRDNAAAAAPTPEDEQLSLSDFTDPSLADGEDAPAWWQKAIDNARTANDSTDYGIGSGQHAVVDAMIDAIADDLADLAAQRHQARAQATAEAQQ